MSNDRIPDLAGQVCVGPKGHVTAGSIGEAFSALIPTFPDVRLIARPALIGERCTGIFSAVAHEWGATGPGPHLGALLVLYDPPRPQAPRAFVRGLPGAPGEVARAGHNGEDLGPADRQRLVDAYQAVIEGRGGPLQRTRRRGWAGEPDAIDRAVSACRILEAKYEDEDEGRITDQDVIDYLHTSRATFYRVLGARNVQFHDILRMARDEGTE
jgi:hypothetical protein